MSVILDHYIIPAQGIFEIQERIMINISAEEARKLVNRWLLDEVSLMIGADTPTMVITDGAVWRVPVWIAFPRQGRYDLGFMEVNVENRSLLNPIKRKAEIQAQANKIGASLPPYTPRKLPTELLPTA